MSQSTDPNAEDYVAPAAPPVVTPPTAPQGKVWTDEYVQGLREEAKTNRLAKKSAEAKLKTLLGLKEDEDIDDAKITAYQASLTKAQNDAIAKANARLITADIKSLEGYNAKLVEALIDKSKVTIADDGTTNVKELVAALEVEFPQIKVGKVVTPPGNPPPSDLSEVQQLEAEYNAAMKKGDMPTAVALKNKLFALSRK